MRIVFIVPSGQEMAGHGGSKWKIVGAWSVNCIQLGQYRSHGKVKFHVEHYREQQSMVRGFVMGYYARAVTNDKGRTIANTGIDFSNLKTKGLGGASVSGEYRKPKKMHSCRIGELLAGKYNRLVEYIMHEDRRVLANTACDYGDIGSVKVIITKDIWYWDVSGSIKSKPIKGHK